MFLPDLMRRRLGFDTKYRAQGEMSSRESRAYPMANFVVDELLLQKSRITRLPALLPLLPVLNDRRQFGLMLALNWV